MNTETNAKYSIENLPGDPWEMRRTKQIVRALLRAKNRKSMTTKDLAQACNRFLSEENAIKESTLNGLFAGKRKSISIVELTMFARAVQVSIDELLYPPAEEVEERPGRFMSSADALLYGLRLVIPKPSIMLGGRAESIIEIRRHGASIEYLVGGIIHDSRVHGSDWRDIPQQILELKWRVDGLQRACERLRRDWNDEPPTTPETASWALDTSPDAINLEFVLSLTDRFEGQLKGEVYLGPLDVNGRPVYGKHSEASGR